MTHAYGHRAPKIPHRSLMRHRVALGASPLPPAASLRSICPPVRDQGPLGACTAFSADVLVQILTRRQIVDGVWTGQPLETSPLGTYYLERVRDGTTEDDAGASLADAAAVLSEDGAIPESEWPYDITRAYDPPPSIALVDAAHVKLADFAPLDHDLDTIRATLAQGFPIHFAVQVYDSFEADAVHQSGDVPLPDMHNEQLLGGHALALIGYDDSLRRFAFLNSWGDAWGDHGFGSIAYDYVLDADLCTELYAWRRLMQAVA